MSLRLGNKQICIIFYGDISLINVLSLYNRYEQLICKKKYIDRMTVINNGKSPAKKKLICT